MSRFEQVDSTKNLFITEIGWQATTTGGTGNTTQQKQASNLSTAYDVFSQDPRITMAAWFFFQDAPGNKPWGLLGGAGKARPAYKSFQQVSF